MANVGGVCGIAAVTQTQQLGRNKCSDLHHGRFTSKDSGPFSQYQGNGWGNVPIWRFRRRQEAKK